MVTTHEATHWLGGGHAKPGSGSLKSYDDGKGGVLNVNELEELINAYQ